MNGDINNVESNVNQIEEHLDSTISKVESIQPEKPTLNLSKLLSSENEDMADKWKRKCNGLELVAESLFHKVNAKVFDDLCGNFNDLLDEMEKNTDYVKNNKNKALVVLRLMKTVVEKLWNYRDYLVERATLEEKENKTDDKVIPIENNITSNKEDNIIGFETNKGKELVLKNEEGKAA